MILTFNGRRYSFRTPTNFSHRGSCSNPTDKEKTICIHAPLRGEERLEVLIHEMLHASCWDLAEESVERAAVEIARALWRLGYRGEK